MTSIHRPLSIAFFIEGMSASGVDTSTCLLAKELRKRGHRVTRFLPWKDETHLSAIDEVVLLPSLRVSRRQEVYWAYPLNLPLFEKFHKEQFDLIHIHTNTVINLLAWQIAGAFHLPIVYTYHTMAKDYAHYLGPIHDHMGRLVGSAIEGYDRLICERANAVLTPSAKAANYLQEIGVEDVQIVPNGIDLSAFQPIQSQWLQKRFAIPAEHKILLFVGRLNQEKRPLLAYECFRQVAQLRDDVHLVMVGDGAFRQELTEKAAADQLSQRFHLTGLVKYQEMPEIYSSANFWISTSSSEVHPMVAIEAAACGLPAVCWRDAALTGVIEDQVNGFVVDSQEAFCASLLQLLENEERAQQMRQQAIRKVSRFQIETTAQEMVDVYESVLSRHKPRAKPLYVRMEKSLQSWQQRIEEKIHGVLS